MSKQYRRLTDKEVTDLYKITTEVTDLGLATLANIIARAYMDRSRDRINVQLKREDNP